MGNCLGSQPADSDASTTNARTSTRPSSTLGTSTNYSNVGLSATSSSAGHSRFSGTASDETTSTGEILPTPNLREYSFADLKIATRNFKSDMVLGVGGFGTVFKGWVDEKTLAPSKFGCGMIVAIKKLNPESMQGFEEWQSEVKFLGRLSHPNLVKLLGYCCEDEELLLVYEFMQRGSLENHLFRRSSATEPLSWDIQLKIAIGAARGLAFLHTSEKKVIYRDFKASNILLDGNYNAKIADLGLAKLGPSGGNSHVTTRIVGTYGYAAPEYVATGHLYVKSDVYGFGVVLLELLTGLRALDNKRPRRQRNLVDWAKPFLFHKRKLKSIMDARIEGQYSSKASLQVAQLTVKCLEREPRNRPSMKEVIEVLERIEAIKATTTSHHHHHHHHGMKSLHFALFQHETINETGYIIVNGVAGPAVGQTTTPFGTLFAFQDPMTLTPNRTSKVAGTAEGTSITSSLDGLQSISIAKISLNMKRYKGSISIVGGTHNIKPSDHPVVGGTGDFVFVQGYVTSSPVDLTGLTVVYKIEFHLYWPPYATQSSS
ncbi:hypothetical protein F0562_006792 [Nyssa sinensis]|uniref:Dirigent protein n=1 Tax=Nyssa sinensis TaxID=561372 RepID=A0A5J5AQK8_9ASTE|nr:hypothetical protein F0562_006792 [Nyssa sinensis]